MSYRCPDCFRPESNCLCAYTKQIDSGIKFVFLMHPKEAKRQRTGTGRLSRITLKDSEIIMGIDFTNDKRLKRSAILPRSALSWGRCLERKERRILQGYRQQKNTCHHHRCYLVLFKKDHRKNTRAAGTSKTQFLWRVSINIHLQKRTQTRMRFHDRNMLLSY